MCKRWKGSKKEGKEGKVKRRREGGREGERERETT